LPHITQVRHAGYSC